MPYPSWLGYLFAAALMVVGAYCLARLVGLLVLRCRDGRDIAAGHVLMAFAMVGMLVPRWNIAAVGFWEVVFAVLALWFFTRSGLTVTYEGFSLSGTPGRHLRHYLIHAVMAATMLYMYWLGMPMTGSGTMVGMGGSMPDMSQSMSSGPPVGAGDPGLTLFLIVILLVSAVWQLDGIGRPDHLHQPVAVVAVTGGAGVTGSPLGDGEPSADRAGASRWLAPQFSVLCHIVMCISMAYMLVLMA